MEIDHDKLKRDGEIELLRFKARAEEARNIDKRSMILCGKKCRKK
jgi:hypothetical protein